MKHLPIFCMLLAVLAGLSGCNIPTAVPSASATTAPSATPYLPGTATQAASPSPLPSFTALPATVTPPAPAPSATAAPSATPAASTGGLSLETLKNFTYTVESPDMKVPLHDGAYTGDHIDSRLVDPVAFGDLNGDGQPDAVLVLATNTGGSGRFYDLIPVINQNGTPVQAGYSSVGDRQVVKNLTIENGRVVLDYLTQGPNDGLCCPSEHRMRSYILDGGVLRLASEQVLTERETNPTPLPDAILIDAPAEMSPLTNPVKVTGRVSQVPPEKTLAYYVTEITQAPLIARGEVPLEGAVGGPGTFSFEIPLDSVPAYGVYKVEVVDSANGILRGRSVIELLGK